MARPPRPARARRLIGGLAIPLVALSLACGGQDETGAAENPADSVPTPEELETPDPDSIYDEQGRLLASERVLGGLVLPRGLGEPQTGAGRHIFTTRVPARKLAEYFGPRLFTGRVERSGDAGARFLNATPIEPQGGAMRMDVMILERTPRERSVIVRLINPPTTYQPASPEELREYHQRLD